MKDKAVTPVIMTYYVADEQGAYAYSHQRWLEASTVSLPVFPQETTVAPPRCGYGMSAYLQSDGGDWQVLPTLDNDEALQTFEFDRFDTFHVEDWDVSSQC